MYGLYFVRQTVGFSQYSSTCPAQYVVVQTVFFLHHLRCTELQLIQQHVRSFFTSHTTSVYAGWSKVNMRWVAAPLV